MKIEELEPNTKVINLIGQLQKLDEITETPTGVKVQDGILKDSTGQVKIALWAEQAGRFKEGDKIIMTTGWCKTFEDELQVSPGKFGKILRYTDPEVKN